MRFGVVGTAHWARTVTIPVLRAHPDVELVALTGRDRARSDALATEVGCRSTDFETLLAGVDAVAFVVPPAVQGELARRAAEAGRHLVLEKPVAADLAAAEALESAARDAGVAAVVFLTRLFVPSVRAFLASVADLGATSAAAQFRSNALLEGSPYAGSTWRQAVLGEVWDVTPHALSVLTPILGGVTEVSGKRADDGTISLAFTHTGGTSTLTIDLRNPERDLLERYAVTGTGGERVFENVGYDRAGAFRSAVENLMRQVRYGADTAPLSAAVDIVAVAAAAAEAITTGTARPVARPPRPLPLPRIE